MNCSRPNDPRTRNETRGRPTRNKGLLADIVNLQLYSWSSVLQQCLIVRAAEARIMPPRRRRCLLPNSACASSGWPLSRHTPTTSVRTLSSTPPPRSRPWLPPTTPTRRSSSPAHVAGVFAASRPPSCSLTPRCAPLYCICDKRTMRSVDAVGFGRAVGRIVHAVRVELCAIGDDGDAVRLRSRTTGTVEPSFATGSFDAHSLDRTAAAVRGT